jgi:hypothetical protein
MDYMKKPRRNQKKTDLKFINLIRKEELESEQKSKNYIPKSDGSNQNKKLKIGLREEDLMKNPAYLPQGNKLPRISNKFNSITNIGMRLEEERKAKKKASSKTSASSRYKKIENHQKMSSRYHLIERSKTLKIYRGESYQNFDEILQNQKFNEKKERLEKVYKGMQKQEIEDLDKTAIEKRYTKIMNETQQVQGYFGRLETEKNSKKLAANCVKFVEKKQAKNLRVAKEYVSRAKKLSKDAS